MKPFVKAVAALWARPMLDEVEIMSTRGYNDINFDRIYANKEVMSVSWISPKK